MRLGIDIAQSHSTECHSHIHCLNILSTLRLSTHIPCLYIGMVNRVFFIIRFSFDIFLNFISDFFLKKKKQIPGMIGTSILTVYQGHISKASLKSRTDTECSLRSPVCMNSSFISASFPRSEQMFFFFFSFYYQDQTCSICENFDNVLKCFSLCLFRIMTC